MVMTPFIDGTITVLETDNQGVVDIKEQAQAMLYIEYVKGTEQYILIALEVATRDDDTEFFQHSYLSSSPEIKINPMVIKMDSSGKLRYPFPVSLKEDKLRVSIKGSVLGGSPGTIKIYHHNSHYSARGLVK